MAGLGLTDFRLHALVTRKRGGARPGRQVTLGTSILCIVESWTPPPVLPPYLYYSVVTTAGRGNLGSSSILRPTGYVKYNRKWDTS